MQYAETNADRLVAAIRAGGEFAALAQKYSAVKQTAAKGGEIGWLQEGVSGVDKELVTTAFTKSANEVFTLKNAQGTQILQVMEKTAPRSKVKLAILERKVVPSSKSYSKIYNEAKQFAALDLNEESFDKAAKDIAIDLKKHNYKEVTEQLEKLEKTLPEQATESYPILGSVKNILRSIIDTCKKHVKEDVEPEFKDMLKTLESSFDKFTNK